MKIVKLVKLFRSDKSKDGKPLLTKDGRPYERLVIKCVEYGGRFISGFSNKDNSYWREGDEVEINITESEIKDKNGQPYLNFSMPSIWDMFREIEKRVKKLEDIQELDLVAAKGEPEKIDELDELNF